MEEQLREKKHSPWPGYRTAFLITFATITLYLAIIILSAPDGGSVGGYH